jgi:outer membrane receptor protein involved in Fe transport
MKSSLKQAVARGFAISIATLFLLVMVASSAMAQTETGQITGKVVDPQDKIVPGAMVTVKSVGTGAERTATSDDQGGYLVTNLQPGLYDVTVKSGQFAENTQRVQVTVGSRVSMITKLSTQSVAATVDVVLGIAGVEINTSDQQISSVIDQKQVRELPTLTRNPYALVGIAGNVTSDPSGRGAGYAINGLRSASTSILLDGVENVDNFTATVGQAVPLESVQEFRVITGTFSAEYGRASGGVVNVATIAGTNSFHGTGYEFNRISKLASNGYNNNAFNIPRSVFTRNQFGYSIGGPIMKNKLFFFSNTEWIRVRSGGSRVSWVPTAQLISATAAVSRAFFAPYQLGGTSGTTISAAALVTAFGGAAAFKPTPNAPVNAFLTFANANPNTPVLQQVTYSTPRDVGGGTPENEYQNVERVDFNMSDKTQIYGRYALQNQVFALGTNAFSPYQGFSTGSANKNQNFLFSVTHTFGPTMVSQTKLAFNRLNGGQPLGSQPLVPTLYMNAGRTVSVQSVNIAMPGYLPFSPGNAIPFNGAQNSYQLNEDISKTSGKQTWRFGGQFIQIRDNKTFGAYSYAVEALGSTNGESLSNLITGNLVSFSVAIDPGNRYPGALIPLPVGPPSFSRSNRYNEWSVYANDSIRYTPRLTLNFGLRYEYYGVQHNAQSPSLDANFFYGAGATYQDRIRSGSFGNTPISPVGGLWAKDNNNFAPRVGFAWDMFGDGKTSLRGGYGLAYERNFGNVTFNVLFNPPNYGVVALSANSGTTIGDVPNLPVSISNYGPFSGSGPARRFSPVSARAVDQNIVNAYAHFWSLSFAREIKANTIFSLEYSASAGRKLYSISDINRTGGGTVYGMGNILNAVGTSTSRFNGVATAANSRGNLGRSDYNGLTASIQGNNFRKTGLNFTARYTFSGAKDNLSSTFSDGAAPFFLGFTDTFDPGADRGWADYDVRHRFVGAANYEPTFLGKGRLRGGWSLNGIVSLVSGSPFTIYDCTNSNQTCARLLPSGPVNISGNPPDTGDANSFTYANLSNQTLRVPGNPLIGNYNFGPFPANMTARNAFRGPGAWNVDFGLHKLIQFNERFALQLRGEAFNIFNHANMYVDYGSPDVSGGNVLSYRDGRRNLQLAAKIIF